MRSPSECRARAKKAGVRIAHPPPGEEIVISGLSGKFPDSNDVYEFRDKLFDKVDLISDDARRWKLEHPEIPQRTGKINDITKFDASFFGLHYKQAHTMDPMGRLLLERTYEAVVDAGINPEELRGKRCGVFVGACFSESEKTWFYEKINVNGYGITGCSRTMLANRISHWLGLEGPSYTVDSACSSSLYAMDQAYQNIREGLCDMAIVGSCNLCLHPYVSLQFYRLGVLSQDGACKSFDNSANGYCRSEAIPVVILQKAKDARRIYSTIVHCKTNCDGYKEQGITYPSGQMQYELLREFYEECGIDPTTVDFIEAHGTGTKVGDPEECNTLDKIFCTGRKDPLLIGSIKSNIGHTEPASGLCSITKAIIAMESGYIPPNLHFKTPREGILAFTEGRLKVVTEKEPWKGVLIGVNSFGFGGANCHILLKINEKKKLNKGAPNDNIPRLVLVSGRTKESVEVFLNELESHPVDVEYVKLLHDLHSENICGHIYRGYTVLSSSPKRTRGVKYFSGERSEVWFVFTGIKGNWSGVEKAVMEIPAFALAIEKCHNALTPFSLDLKKLLRENKSSSKSSEKFLHNLVVTTAVQIGLVDLLFSLGVFPDGILGYSFGEFASAYADGCLSFEQTILAAYYTGLSILEANVVTGDMIDVGMEYKTIKQLLPPELDVAFVNSQNSCTLSGPSNNIKKFHKEISNQGVVVNEVFSFDLPLHSRYIAKAAPKLLGYLKKVIPVSKPKTTKWHSLSNQTYSKAYHGKMCSPEYFVDCMLNSVELDKVNAFLSADAVVLEVASVASLQNVLKTLKNPILSFSLSQNALEKDHDALFSTIGQLYEYGFQPQVANMYPPVQYPVSQGTKMISPFVRWEHSHDWYITSYRMQEKIKSGERSVVVSVKDEDYEYVVGHMIDGRNLFPATGYIALVWETVSMMIGQLYTQLPIVFENVKFNRATTLPKDGSVEFIIMVQKASGKFEISEGGASVVTGRAYVPDDINAESLNLPEQTPAEGKDLIALNGRDIYKELRLRGYQYKGLFRGLVSLDNLGKTGKITWANNYVAFMDNLLQTQILQEDTRSLYVPTTIRKLVINPLKHAECVEKVAGDETILNVSVYKEIKVIVSGGIEIHELRASQIPRKKPLGEPVLERYRFMPHVTRDDSKALTLLETFRLCFHVILENVQSVKVKVVELGDSVSEGTLAANHIASILGDLPLVQAEIIILASNNPKSNELAPGVVVEDKKITGEQNCLAVIATNLLNDQTLLDQTLKSLKPEGYLIVRENINNKLPLDDFHVLVDRVVDEEIIMLLQSKSSVSKIESESTEVVKIFENDEFQWIEPLKKNIQNEKVKKIFLVAEKEKENGLIGLTNCLRKEPGGEKIRCVFVFDEDAPAFDLNHPLYADQLKKGMAMNVFKDGQWGTYRHEALPSNNTVKVEHIYFNTEIRGDLSSLKMYDGPLNVNQSEKEEVVIYYAAINFRDVMLASGKLAIDAAAKGRINQQLPIGLEFSGRMSKSGRRVMGMTKHGALASKISVDDVILWDIPSDWSMEQAASVPIVYATVYTALVTRGHIRKGESILIHSGTGGVGLAALTVAKYYGCNIFTTVGTPEKKEYLRQIHPEIPESHIGNSRDTSFEDMIKRETNGRGVDIILNSLSEEKLQASLRCLATDGRFLEIGKFDLSNDNPIAMEIFSKSTSFHGVHLDGLLYSKNYDKREEVRNLLKDVLKNAKIEPLKTTVYDYTECEQAFRYLTTGKHIGKVMLKLRDEEPKDVCVPEKKLFEAHPQVCCSRKKTYVILGGLGGFGLELADWLVMRGAKKLVLTSRTGLKTGYQALRIRLWRNYGVEIIISTENVTTEQGVVNLLKQAESLGPVGAIFNLAVVLRDAIFENQTEEAFNVSFGPKALATKHLDKVSRKLCPELDYFVIFSSVSCGRGNAGQTNYGMANSVMERICEKRVQEGYPGLAIQWGAIGEVGLVAEMQEDHQELVIGGTLQQTISSCLKCMDVFLKQKHPVVASMVVAEKKAGGSGGGNIVEAVVNILGIQDLKTVSLHSPLAELGMDSMMAVEIKQTLEREFDVYLTAQDIRGLTFAKLKLLADNSNAEGGGDGKGELSPVQEAETKRLEFQKLLFRLVADEETSEKSMIPLESAQVDLALFEKLKSINEKMPPVFFIPGFEGVASVLEPLAKKITCPTLALQFPYNDIANSSMTEIASRMLKIVKSHMVRTLPFFIVGYSTGCVVTVELTRMLEEEGYKGVLILLDGSPDYLKKIVQTVFGDLGDDSLDSNLLHAIYNYFVPGTNMKILDELNALSSWEEKLVYMQTVIPEQILHKKEHQKRIASDFRHRLTAVINYDTSTFKKLSANVTLIKPVEQYLSSAVSEDYGLSTIFEKPVDVHIVEGNHMSMLEGAKVAHIINQKYKSIVTNTLPKFVEDIEPSLGSTNPVKTR